MNHLVLWPSDDPIKSFNEKLVENILFVYYPADNTPEQLQKINSVVGNFYNSFIQPQQSAQLFYSAPQRTIISGIMAGIDQMDVSDLGQGNFWSMYTENVSLSSLTAQQQAPLLLALAITDKAWQILYEESLDPDNDWQPFLDTNPAINLINLRGWVKAIFKGALIGYTQSTVFTPTIATDGVGIGDNIITTVMGALSATFGKVVLKWVKRPALIG